MNSSVSLIDNILTNNKNLALYNVLLITNISGHFPLFSTLSIKYNVKIKSKTYVLLCYKFISFMFDTNLNNLLFI